MASRHSYDPEKAGFRNTSYEMKPISHRRNVSESLPFMGSYSDRENNHRRGFSLSFLRRRRSILSRAILALVAGFIVFKLFFQDVDQDDGDILQYIDPQIGTAGGGHVFAGATVPFGMAKPVADIVSNQNVAGFAWDFEWDNSTVSGFSSLHDSGGGALASMGNFPIFLQPSWDGADNWPLKKQNRDKPFLWESVQASPGFFGLTLESGVRAEMTATERASLFRFSFEAGTNPENPVLVMDASDLPNTSGPRLLRIDPKSHRIIANGTFRPSFGQGEYSSYQCLDVKGAEVQDYGYFNDYIVGSKYPKTDEFTNQFWAAYQGLYISFKDVNANDQIMARVGLSWISTERACENAEREITDFDFDRVLEDARTAWRKKFKPISMNSKGVSKMHLRNFWSGAYRAFLSPQDYTGENQKWNSTEPYYDSWYCIWDTFRGVHPFYMLIDTISQSRMVRSLIDIYKHEGWLPECRMSFCKGYTQGGSNADVIIVDSYFKKLPGIDWDAAYAAIVKDAEVQPENWNVEGRGGLASWKEKGYIPYQDDDKGGLKTRSISRTVEYAYNDFCIAMMANATGRADDFRKYAYRASNWKNLYDPDHESMGFKGFPQPRWDNGTFAYQDADLCSPLNSFHSCYLDRGGHETYEGSPWLYLFYVPGDVQGLIDLLGGREAFLQRLETLHESGVLYMGDEQAFLTAFLYHYAGRPGLSAKKTHELIPSMFNDTVGGIPGNDDSGAMGTFVLFSMMGIFPSAGQNVYFIIPPYFPSISITNPETGKRATIINYNFDPSYKKIYIQSAMLNGRPYTRNWVSHNFFLNGGTLELVLGETESTWGTRQEDVPPSLSTGLHLG